MKDFDAWNEIKKKVDKTDINFFYKQQENFPGTYANLSQIRTIDSKRLISRMGFLSKDSFDKVRKLIRDFNGL